VSQKVKFFGFGGCLTAVNNDSNDAIALSACARSVRSVARLGQVGSFCFPWVVVMCLFYAAGQLKRMIFSTQPRKSSIIKTIIKRGVQAAAGIFFKVGANVKLDGEFVRLLAGDGLQNLLAL